MKRVFAFLCVLAMVLSLVPATAFAAEQDLQALIDAGAEETIVLEADASDITITRDTYIDLNGHSIDGVTVLSGTLYCQDSQTADYTVADGVYGEVTNVTGAVKAADGYLQVGNSFHAVNLDIYAMTLRANDVGVYYKSNFAADEIVAAQVESFGVALSVITAPTAANLETYCGYSAFTGFEAGEGANAVGTSTLLKDIMKASNSEATNARNSAMSVYGRAYIKTSEGYFFGETVKRSLKEQVEAIDGVWAKLSDAQKTPVLNMLEKYNSVMTAWNIPNILGIQTPGTEVEVKIPVAVTVENGAVAETVTVEQNGVSVTVPAGTKLVEGANGLTVIVTEKETSEAGLTLEESEVLMPMDVHVEGLAADNTAPLTIYLGKVMAENLNMGNYAVYHVENGKANEMVLIPADAEFTAHNQYKYTLDGELTLYMATFSEVAVVSDKDNKWNGEFDYSWYDAAKTELYIRNADQLAGFGAIVGGMNGKTADDFSGKIVKLDNDIYIGDTTDEDGRAVMFYPIGYYNTTGSYEKKAGVDVTSGFRNFSGTFDGTGHTISDFYQNTWEAFGDYNDGYSGKPNHYRDGFGLFGRVYKGTVKNLTVKNFQSDGEFTTTGTIAAYAEGATFEGIAIFNCNPRVYNIGNGGIVGCVGWYAKEADLKTTFKNITVDNTNKITALWGSWDVACGGIVGQYYPTSGQTSANKPANGGVHFENCHVSAQIDVYNDVCANYQYYAYRYAGILMGSVRENVIKDGHEYPDMTGITATNCTVHFGDWNDYYYCELVANSLASYTHDHQMSRLVQVEKLDVNAKKYLPLGKADVSENWVAIPESGRQNYVVVNGKAADGKWDHGDGKATCYHFVNGVQHKHDVADSDNPNVYETVDGKEVLVEDKQCIYREFNNLVTGYGWGVTSKGVDDMEGVKILDREVADSVVKFETLGVKELESEVAISIGSLFEAKSDATVAIKPDQVQVAVSPADKDSTVSGTYTAGSNWSDGKLVISGKGAALITIQDYYFCTPTTIEVTVIDPMQSLDVAANMLYVVGTELKINAVTVSYKNGTAKTLAADEYTVGAYDFSFAGKKDVTISYTELGYTITKVIRVEVTDQYNALHASAKRKVYNINYEFTVDDFNVTAIDSSGKKHEVSGWSVEPVDASTAGTKTVVIKFTNTNTGNAVTTSCEVTIYNLTVLDDTENEHVMYWMTPGQYSLNGWRPYYWTDQVEYDEVDSGEIARGFTYSQDRDVDWIEVGKENSPTGYVFLKDLNRYSLTIENAKPYTAIGINCLVGYDAEVKAFGYYIGDDMSNFAASVAHPIDRATEFGGTNDENYLFGPNACGAVTDFVLSDLNPGGVYTIHWVAVFEDGIQHLTDWTVKMASESQSDAVFVDHADKPNVNVIVMAGQSNMFGASPITQSVREAYGNFNFSNVFLKYSNINFNVNPDGSVANTLSTVYSNDDFEKYQLGMGGQADTYFGPETALAYQLATADGLKNQQWFIIKYAAAGTGLAAQWMNTCNLDGKNVTLTEDMISYVQDWISVLEGRGYDVQIRSFMWMQGESDASAQATAESYAANEKVLVNRVRNAWAANATRYEGDTTVAGGGIAFINAGIAINDKQEPATDANNNLLVDENGVPNGGPNNWLWASAVNAGKISNCQQLCSVPGYNAAVNGEALQTGPLAGLTFAQEGANGETVCVPTIVNPDLTKAILNSIYIDTHYLESKLATEEEHPEYVVGDTIDWAHYGAASMNVLGELFASCNQYMMVTGPIAPAVTKYTVTFDANGGVSDSENITGNPVVLPTATRDGYNFLGWYTEAEGGKKVGGAGSSYKPTANVTLYAQWERVVYTVTYDANGGNVTPANATANVGESVTLPTPTREGYTFKEWSDGTNTYTAGAEYTVNGDVTLTAQWKENGHTFTVDNKVSGLTYTGIETGDVAIAGETKTFTINYSSNSITGKKITVTVNGTQVYSETLGGWFGSKSATVTFEVPAGDVTITIK